MSYITEQDLIERFGEDEILALSDRDDSGTPDPEVITQAIEDADGEINSRVGVKYSTPIEPAPPVLQAMACDIARYRLYGVQATDQVKERYNNAIAFLNAVASGRAVIDGVTESPPAGIGGIEAEAHDRVFSMDTLQDF